MPCLTDAEIKVTREYNNQSRGKAMSTESQDEQKHSETQGTETPQGETIHQRLKRLSQSDPSGKFFVDSSNVGPIVFHHLGSFEPKDHKGKK